MGEEGEEKCLSQHKSLPRHFQGSGSHPKCDSRQRLQDQRGTRPSPARVVRASSGTCNLALTRTPPTDAVFRCPALRHIRNPFPRRPLEGSFCIPGIVFSVGWLRGQLAEVFKGNNNGNPSHFFSSLQDPKLPLLHKKHHPLSLAAFVTKTVFYDCRFLN